MNADEIIKKFDLTNSTWTFKGFHGVLHTFYPVGDAVAEFDYEGDHVQPTIFFVKENYLSWYWRDSDLRRLRTKFVAQIQKDPSYLDARLAEWKKRLKHFDEVIAKTEKTNLSKLSDDKLLAAYDEFYATYVHEYRDVIVLQDAYSMYSGEFLEPAFKAFFESKKQTNAFQEHYNLLMSPAAGSFLNEELKARYYLLVEIQKYPELSKAFEKSPKEALKKLPNFKLIETKIENHAKQFFFVKNNYAIQVRIDKKDVVESIHSLMEDGKNPVDEIENMERELENNKKEKAKLIKQFSIPANLQTLIKVTEVFTEMQDTRKKYVMISSLYQREFFEEVGKRIGVPAEEMAYTIYPELKDMLLNHKIDRKKLQQRKKHCVSIQMAGKHWIFEGKVVDEVFERVFAVKENVSEIKGLIASAGRASGPVRIIQKIHDFANMQEGDVLVTSMTRPEFVPVMKKAAAIITDEGGITSHAAIVSREMHKPCIIGTKVATKVLKNGQRVDVNANTGIVTILT